MTREKRLGRGLAALLGSSLEDEVVGLGESGLAGEEPQRPRTTDATNAAQPDLLYLKADEIDANPFQPRREFNESEIASLAESLKSHEMLAPILVRQVNGRYQLISGERRLRAAIRAGWPTVPARLRKADDRLVAELAIVENVQRKDLNPIEKAMAFKRYIDEHACTQDELAQRIKIDRSTIANLMRLLELPAKVLDALRKGDITAGHARALLPLGEESEQIAFSERIQREGLSVRDTERQVQEMVFKEDSPPDVVSAKSKRPKRTTTQQVASLQQELRMALGTKVEIRQSSRGRGRIVVHFQSHEEFERMRELLTGGTSRKTREAA